MIGICLNAVTMEHTLVPLNTETDLDEAEVLAVISTYKKNKKYAAVDRSLGTCRNCGYQHPVNRCPAFGKLCLKCGTKGHFYKMCLGGGGNSSKKLSSSALFISPIIHTCSKQKDSLPRLTVLVGDNFVPCPHELPVIADTGAEVTVIGDKYLAIHSIKDSMLNMTKTKLQHEAGGDIPVVGSCWLSFQVDGHRCVE